VVQILLETWSCRPRSPWPPADAARPVLGEYQRLPAEQLYVRAVDLDNNSPQIALRNQEEVFLILC